MAGVVVKARTPKLELEVVEIPHKVNPGGVGGRDTAPISFYVRDSDPHAKAQIVGPGRDVVRTLYRGPLTAYERVTFRWNGRTSAGRLANPRDAYRLRVVLPSEDRDMVYPAQIELAERGTR